MRRYKVDATGKVRPGYMSRLDKIGVGLAHKGRAVKLLVAARVSA